jgi:hypothetical protein
MYVVQYASEIDVDSLESTNGTTRHASNLNVQLLLMVCLGTEIVLFLLRPTIRAGMSRIRYVMHNPANIFTVGGSRTVALLRAVWPGERGVDRWQQ